MLAVVDVILFSSSVHLTTTCCPYYIILWLNEWYMLIYCNYYSSSILLQLLRRFCPSYSKFWPRNIEGSLHQTVQQFLWKKGKFMKTSVLTVLCCSNQICFTNPVSVDALHCKFILALKNLGINKGCLRLKSA